jgi:hypothetical protein
VLQDIFSVFLILSIVVSDFVSANAETKLMCLSGCTFLTCDITKEDFDFVPPYVQGTVLLFGPKL